MEACLSVSSFISKTTQGMLNKFGACWSYMLEGFGGI
jgi:hypothetical protein